MTSKVRVYSLGYQGISLDKYVEVLKANNVAAVADVRETAWSYKPGFSKKPLEMRLRSEGIAYFHVKSAGNPSKNRKGGHSSEAIIDLYRAHLDADSSCLHEVSEIIRDAQGAVCLLCFESAPHECHRTVILDRLSIESLDLVTCHLHGNLPALEQ